LTETLHAVALMIDKGAADCREVGAI